MKLRTIRQERTPKSVWARFRLGSYLLRFWRCDHCGLLRGSKDRYVLLLLRRLCGTQTIRRKLHFRQWSWNDGGFSHSRTWKHKDHSRYLWPPSGQSKKTSVNLSGLMPSSFLLLISVLYPVRSIGLAQLDLHLSHFGSIGFAQMRRPKSLFRTLRLSCPRNSKWKLNPNFSIVRSTAVSASKPSFWSLNPSQRCEI